MRGRARLEAGDPAGARADADSALSLNPRQLSALELRAEAARRLGDLPAALVDLKAAQDLLEKAGRPQTG